MKTVKAKKKLGQHFLNDLNIAKKIANTLKYDTYSKVLEIGPGMGVLTQYLPHSTGKIHLIEIDHESIVYLKNKYPLLEQNIIKSDFLKYDLSLIFGNSPFAIIGNFPYNISTQIVFKTIENRNQIPFFSGMFQKEVAERICEAPGTKKYGILSVLVQLFYTATYEFTVPPEVFSPPPKVDSGVLTLRRKENYSLACNEKLLFKIVKMSFQQRRKILRNSLKILQLPINLSEDSIFNMRPEKLSGNDFIGLTQKIENGKISS
tara:strand:- start:1509 stop:2294 length:786 start_codon:yes stop_codon:yes gene_type:complete